VSTLSGRSGADGLWEALTQAGWRRSGPSQEAACGAVEKGIYSRLILAFTGHSMSDRLESRQTAAPDPNLLEEQIKKLQWFHSININGIITPGECSYDTLMLNAELYFSVGIEGMTVLDVGAWDGFFSFKAEEKGASRVLAVDKFAWGHGGWGTREPFLFARSALKSKVEDRLLDLDETTLGAVGHFDIALFNGIIYHVINPLTYLIEMFKLTRYLLIVETFVDKMDDPRPVMVFYPGDTVKHPGTHPQNGFGVNSLFMMSYLKRIGFETVLEMPNPEGANKRKVYMAFKAGHPWSDFVARHKDKETPTLSGTSA
jgi:tRNA (mo5U34)-methyltransferase